MTQFVPSSQGSGEEPYGFIGILVTGITAGVSVLGAALKARQEKKAREEASAEARKQLAREKKALEMQKALAKAEAEHAAEEAASHQSTVIGAGLVLMLMAGAGGLILAKVKADKVGES